MKLDDYVAVSGMSGLFRLVANRKNGLVVTELDANLESKTKKSKFFSARLHQFTPLASIGIYTEADTTELSVVFASMLKQLETNPPVAAKALDEEIVAYFGKILPEFDRDRVKVSDIRKVIKWFNFLNERHLLSLDETETETEPASEEASVKEEKTKEA